jgi:hypothetical protein
MGSRWQRHCNPRRHGPQQAGAPTGPRRAAQADGTSLAALAAIVRYLLDEAPGRCWGSPAAVQAWLRDGGGTCAVCGADVPAGETCPSCDRPLCRWSCCDGDEGGVPA